MTQLSENFVLSEFAVSGSHPELVEPVPERFIPNVERLVRDALQPMRTDWGRPFDIRSGYRSAELNKKVGGSATSQHRTAAAADVTTADVRPLFFRLLRHPDKYPMGQVIFYPGDSFVHVALPSKRYPTPAFFVSPSSKKYIRVKTLGEALAAER